MTQALSDREHAHFARLLIEECGGVSKAQMVTGLSAATLSRYQNTGYAETMPAKVINLLEVFCERKVYSPALCGAIDATEAEGAVDDIACDLTEAVARVQSMARSAMRDGRLTPREVSELAKVQASVKKLVEKMDSSLRAHDGGASPLRVVSA